MATVLRGLSVALVAPYTVALLSLAVAFFFIWPLVVYFLDTKGMDPEKQAVTDEKLIFSKVFENSPTCQLSPACQTCRSS